MPQAYAESPGADVLGEEAPTWRPPGRLGVSPPAFLRPKRPQGPPRLDPDGDPGARLKEVDGVYEAHHPCGVAHDDGVGPGPAPEEAHALQDVPVGDPGGGEDDLLPGGEVLGLVDACLLYTSPSPRDRTRSRMPSSA